MGQTYSEASIMARYLHEKHGIALEHILQEGKSTSTAENLIYSQVILAAKEVPITAPIAIVTSDFHTIRAAAIAKHQAISDLFCSPARRRYRFATMRGFVSILPLSVVGCLVNINDKSHQ